MSMSIKNLGDLQKTLEQASKAFHALDGRLANLSFNPHDTSSTQKAIVEMELAIDARLAPYHGNNIVEQTARALKDKYRVKILERAALAKLNHEKPLMSKNNTYHQIFKKIGNVVSDLQSVQSNDFETHIRKLSKLLDSDALTKLNQNLTKGIDLDAWINEGKKTRSGMVGSAKLSWPDDEDTELGTKILLIHYFAKNPDEGSNFSYYFYYNGTNITSNLQNMVSLMIVPFARDYIEYIKSHTETESANMHTEKYVEMSPLKVGFEQLLHPEIQKVSMQHYHRGDYRNAVMDSVTAIYDKIRERTRLQLDGAGLATTAFSKERPLLVISNLDTDSGKSEQIGFMEMIKGLYIGVRNPKAHTLNSELDEIETAQYLVTASLLMRRVCEATVSPQQ